MNTPRDELNSIRFSDPYLHVGASRYRNARFAAPCCPEFIEESNMDANELLALDRPLTPEEMAFVEQEVLKLAKQLRDEVARITSDVPDESAELLD